MLFCCMELSLHKGTISVYDVSSHKQIARVRKGFILEAPYHLLLLLQSLLLMSFCSSVPTSIHFFFLKFY